jgi:hypothetical protein
MKYLTWKVYFLENSNEGSTPDPIIRSRGYEANGLFHITTNTILGVVSNNADISNLDNYEIKEISKEEALEIALTLNDTAYLNDNGELLFAPVVKV